MSEAGERVRLEQALAGRVIECGTLFERGARLFGPVEARQRHAEAVQDQAFLRQVLLLARQQQCRLIVRERLRMTTARPLEDPERIAAGEGAAARAERRRHVQRRLEGT